MVSRLFVAGDLGLWSSITTEASDDTRTSLIDVGVGGLDVVAESRACGRKRAVPCIVDQEKNERDRSPRHSVHSGMARVRMRLVDVSPYFSASSRE